MKSYIGLDENISEKLKLLPLHWAEYISNLQTEYLKLRVENEALSILVRDAEIILAGLFQIENEEHVPAMNNWIKRVQALKGER